MPVAGGVRVLDPTDAVRGAQHAGPGVRGVRSGAGRVLSPRPLTSRATRSSTSAPSTSGARRTRRWWWHPRDPFSRIETRRSSRHVVVELDGEVLADSVRPTVLVENHLPVRH